MGNREGDGNASPSYKHLQRSGADSGAWVGLQGFKVRIEPLLPIFQDSSCRLIIYGVTSVSVVRARGGNECGGIRRSRAVSVLPVDYLHSGGGGGADADAGICLQGVKGRIEPLFPIL